METKPKQLEMIAIARDGVTICKAVLQEKANGDYDIGFTDDAAIRLAPQIEALRVFAAEGAPEKKNRDEVWAKLKELLGGAGFDVKVVPFPTYSLKLTVDTDSGRVIAPPAELVEGEGEYNASLEASVFASVGRALQGAGSDLAAQIQTAIAEGRQAEAARALIEGTTSLTLAFGAADLFAVARLIDIDALEPRDAAVVLQQRVAIAAKLRRRDAAMGADVEKLLTKFVANCHPRGL